MVGGWGLNAEWKISDIACYESAAFASILKRKFCENFVLSWGNGGCPPISTEYRGLLFSSGSSIAGLFPMILWRRRIKFPNSSPILKCFINFSIFVDGVNYAAHGRSSPRGRSLYRHVTQWAPKGETRETYSSPVRLLLPSTYTNKWCMTIFLTYSVPDRSTYSLRVRVPAFPASSGNCFSLYTLGKSHIPPPTKYPMDPTRFCSTNMLSLRN